MQAHKWLKPGGKLIAVMSSGVTFRENKLTREFRELVQANDGDITELPEKSFKVSGTCVNTAIVTLAA